MTDFPVRVDTQGEKHKGYLHARALVTTRRVAAGELLLRETPLIAVHAVENIAMDEDDKRTGHLIKKCGFDPHVFVGAADTTLSLLDVPVTRGYGDPVLCLVEAALMRAPQLVRDGGARGIALRNERPDRASYQKSIAPTIAALAKHYGVSADVIGTFASLVHANKIRVKTVWSDLRYAEALYATASVINHGCRPNTIVTFGNDLCIEVRAACALDEGVEVTRMYDESMYGVQCRAVLQRPVAYDQPAIAQPCDFVCACRYCEAFRTLVARKKVRPVAVVLLNIHGDHDKDAQEGKGERLVAFAWPEPWQYLLITPEADVHVQLLGLQAITKRSWSLDAQSLFLRCFDGATTSEAKFECGACLLQLPDIAHAVHTAPVMFVPFLEQIFGAALAVRTMYVVNNDAVADPVESRVKRHAVILHTTATISAWVNKLLPDAFPTHTGMHRHHAFTKLGTWMRLVVQLLHFETSFSDQVDGSKDEWKRMFTKVSEALPRVGSRALRCYADLLRHATTVRHEPHEVAARYILYELHTCALLKTFIVVVDLAKTMCESSFAGAAQAGVEADSSAAAAASST